MTTPEQQPNESSKVGKTEVLNSLDNRPRQRQFFGRGRAQRILGPRATYYLSRLLGRFVIGVRRFIASRGITRRSYSRWIREYGLISPQERAMMADEIATWPSRPLISVLLPVYNTELRWLRAAIESVRNQIYQHWELCISDDASTLSEIRPLLEHYAAQDSRIHVTFRSKNGRINVNSNSALELAQGDYLALLNAEDCLSVDALFWAAREIALHPDVDLLFSDEDKIDGKGKRFDPYFKPAWNPALMMSQNAFRDLGIYRRNLVEEVGRFRQGFGGAQDHDLVLRCAEKTAPDRIRHIPRVLYHWRVLSGTTAAEAEAERYDWAHGALAIKEHLRRQGVAGDVGHALGNYYQVNYQRGSKPPKVSILIPSTCRLDLLQPCMSALRERSTYSNFEVLLAVNEIRLREPSQARYLRDLERDPRVRVLAYADREFNFSWINNWAASQAQGELFCLMNDDIQIITADWLERLVTRVTRDGVGAAGAMLYYPGNSIQHAGVLLGIGGVAYHVFSRLPRGYPGYFGRAGLEQDYSCLTAACLLVRRAVFEKIRGFDEALPIAFNDVDLCIRIRRTGARIIWSPTVEMYHHESVSIGRHDAGPRRQRFLRDFATIRDRWKDVLDSDPSYNPNLSLRSGLTFTLAWPPRTPKPIDLFAASSIASVSRTSQSSFGNP